MDKIFTILLADDDATVRILMQAALEKSGYRVLLASDGKQAVQLFSAHTVDLVMLDVDMPGMNGYQVCAWLREQVGNELPIMMVTGMDDIESVDKAFDAGATDFIAKPINWNLIHYHILYVQRSYLNMLALKNADARSRAIFSAIPDAMFIMDEMGTVMEICSRQVTMPWLPVKAGVHLQQYLPDDVIQRYLEAIGLTRHNHDVQWFEYPLKLPTGEICYYENRIVAINEQQSLCLVRDITDRKDSEQKIFNMAYFDNLTGLPNRQSFMERVGGEIKRARYQHNKLAVLFLDLDGFKSINDTMGHTIGDVVLKSAAERLQKCMRSSDFISRNGANVSEVNLARLGGDEFTVIVPNLERTEDALLLAHRVREMMRQPFHLASRDIVLTTSIGIALFPDDGEDAETLLKHADTAMYHAKDEGCDNCQFYNEHLTLQAEKRMHLENDLRNALRRNEFFLMYQPQYHVATDCVHAVEALVRWQHPQRGLVPPVEFISLTEENGLIVPLGEWVLRTACMEAMQWQKDGQIPQLAVNLSPVQIKLPELVDTVLTILAETGFPASKLTLEITEGALMEHSEKSLATLQMFRKHGIRIALDDFGTGYSSMSYLKQLPINCIKIDQSFVRGMLQDKENLAIVKTIISLAKNLGFAVTAEGVETLDQARMLKFLACDALQGYYFSRPVLAQDFQAVAKQSWLIESKVDENEIQAGQS